jgi:hypothetical protein
MFASLKKEVLKIDPVAFAENYLTIDGKPLKLGGGTGWKFLADIYRYVAIKGLEPDAKPVICLKGRQIGCTTMATALELYFCTSGLFGTSPERPPIRILHCFPALALVDRFVKDKLSTMMRTAKDNYVLKQSLSYNEDNGKRRLDVPEDTLREKQFKYENRLWVDSNAQDAQRLQGMSVDGIFYDECQHMNQDDIGNSKRTLTAARYGPVNQGIQMYFGTPLQRGSAFHKMWEASDKRIYHLKCEACEEFFPLYVPESDDWEQYWLYGKVVACRKCGHQQDKVEATERGKWIPSQPLMPNGDEPQFVGFHFNQLFIPDFTKEVILKEKPGIHPTNSDRIWKNEILGEFYSGSDMPMSEDEIYKFCRDINRKISFGSESVARVPGQLINGYRPPMFMGIDWGGKADDSTSTKGKSFSSIVIVSVDQAGTLHIENAFKLKSNDFEHKKEVVNEMFRRYDIKICVADLGYGNDIVAELQKEYGSRVIGSLSGGNMIHPVKYDPEELRMIINPNVLLEELFSQMRKGKIKFPWQSYEMLHWLIQHCCSMEKEVRTFQGKVITRYVKGNGPNDGLQAIMYAWLSYRYFLTKGFTMKEFQVGRKDSGPLLAYLPNM